MTKERKWVIMKPKPLSVTTISKTYLWVVKRIDIEIENSVCFGGLLVAEVGESPIGIFTKYNWIENRNDLLDFINIFIPDSDSVSVFIRFLSLRSKTNNRYQTSPLNKLVPLYFLCLSKIRS